jgi:hypothetical protein
MLGSIVSEYEGTIDKFIGDCLMAVFGVPVAIEEAPQKAVNTAIEMRNRLYQFNQDKKVQPPLDIHIGINTGMVIAGEVGSDEKRDYSVMGDTVNLASRLENASEKGQIYVGPQTYRFTKNDFDFKELEPIALKGKQHPVPIFELLSREEKLHRARLGAERMIFSEMVGRDKELALLELQVHKAINGEGSIVSIIGDAGIGKSRLIAELRSRVDRKQVAILEGRAIATGKNLPFYPIIDIFKHWARITEDDTQLESVHKLEKAIRTVYPEGVNEVFPFIATLMGMKLSGSYAQRIEEIEGDALEKLILKNLRELLAKSVELNPLVQIMEDLHWADQTTIEFLESLYRLVEGRGILFINVFRPNYEETGDRILKTIREKYADYHTEIHLEALDEFQSEDLIKNLLNIQGLPAHMKKMITSKAEGNPFFIEEVIRSFIEDGVAVIKDGAFEVTEKIESIVVPETIQDVLMSRIDKLDEKTKSLVKVASVIGRNFFYKVLNEVAETTEEIDEKLELLEEAQLILENKGIEEVEYLFKHALAQEATYESILLQKRKQLHLLTAEAIESVFSERLHEFYGMLALHFSRGENLERAEEYLLKAGEEALKASTSSEALNYYNDALDLYQKKYGHAGDPEKLGHIRKNIAFAHFNKGYMVEAVENIDLVLKYWGEKQTKNTVRMIITLISNLFSVIIRLYLPFRNKNIVPTHREKEMVNLIFTRGRALVYYDANRFFVDSVGLLRILNRLDLTKIENGSAIYCACSALFSLTGLSFGISKRIQVYAEQYLDRKNSKTVFAHNFYKLFHDILSGNWGVKHDYDERGIDQSLKIGDFFHVLSYTHWISMLQIAQGDFNASSKSVDKLREIADLYDSVEARVNEYISHVELLLQRRDLTQALNKANESIAFYNKIGSDLQTLRTYGMAAYAKILQKDLVEAEFLLKQAEEIACKIKARLPYDHIDYLISRFFINLQKLELAGNSNTKKNAPKNKIIYKSGKEALANARKYPIYRTEALRLMGLYYWLRGKHVKALAWWKKSINTGKELQAKPALARTYFEVGKRLLVSNSKYEELDGITAEDYLEKAKIMFKELNLAWDLNELDKIEYQRDY